MKKRKILILFDEMIADMLSNKKLNAIVTEPFFRGNKVNISLVFMTESYFALPKNIRLKSTNYFVIKFADKREIQQIPFIYSTDIDFSSNSSLFRKNLLKRI